MSTSKTFRTARSTPREELRLASRVPWIALLSTLIPIACTRTRLEPTPAAEARTAKPELVSFPTSDGGKIFADSYGHGDRGVVLAHGARFDKESWAKQARTLADAGFRVLAIDFRGHGDSRGGAGAQDPYDGLHLDVLAAVAYLRGKGATSVAVVGGSMGGGAAAEAAAVAEPGSIDRLVLLAHSPIDHPEKMQGRKLFVTSRDDRDGAGTPRLESIREQYERATGPKELLVLDGSAHAQFLFASDQGDRLVKEILRFLSAP